MTSSLRAYLVGLLVVSAGAGCRRGGRPVDAETQSWCFAVAMTGYSPIMDLGEDEEIVRLPERMALGEELYGVEDRRILVPGPETSPEVMRMMHGWWRRTGADGVEVAWTNGFSGVHVALVPSGEGFRGQARTFWDMGRPEQSAGVEFRRIQCW